MSYFNNVWKSLPSELKKKSTILFILILISTCLEVLGIGLIVPVVLFLIEDDLVLKYPFLHSVVSYFFFELKVHLTPKCLINLSIFCSRRVILAF